MCNNCKIFGIVGILIICISFLLYFTCKNNRKDNYINTIKNNEMTKEKLNCFPHDKFNPHYAAH